jgi:hypothetical protein
MLQENDWNPDDWQGRTQEQVETNNTVFLILLGVIAGLVILLLSSYFIFIH